MSYFNFWNNFKKYYIYIFKLFYFLLISYIFCNMINLQKKDYTL